MRFIRRFLNPTVVEYAFMLALIVLAAVVAVSALGTTISSVFENIGQNMGG